jgi:hypothetical protein
MSPTVAVVDGRRVSSIAASVAFTRSIARVSAFTHASKRA